MRALIVILGAMAMLIGVATQPANAGKGTDIDRFVKGIRRFASHEHQLFTAKARSLCVCQDGSAHHTQAGALTYLGELGDQQVTVLCSVRNFDLHGFFGAAYSCDTFEVLSK